MWKRKKIMGHWEDFFILIKNEINILNKEKEFFTILKQINKEKKFLYRDIRDRWDEAYTRIIKLND